MAFDTHASVKKLQEAGFTPQQAEAQVEVLLTVVEGNLATKLDLKEMESRTEVRLKELDAKIELLHQKIELVRQKIELARRDTIIWLGGIVVAGFAVMAAMIGVVIALVAM